MMDERCFAMEELEAMAALPPQDERRLHVESCPRCAALLASMRSFLEPGAPAPGAHPDAAERHLSAFLQKELQEGAPVHRRDSARLSLIDRFREMMFRPAFAAVAVATIAVAILLVIREDDPGQNGILLRGDPESAASMRIPGEVLWLPDGGLQLSWEGHVDTDDYAVIFFAQDLSELARIRSGGEIQLHWMPDQLPDPVLGEARVLWAVAGLREGREVFRTRLAQLER